MIAFDIPLTYVMNSTTAKNEVTIEFHQNDDAAVSLMEVRFHIPPGPDTERDTVAVCGSQFLLYIYIYIYQL